MATLKENLNILKSGKQGIIDSLNNHLPDQDKEDLKIDCSWTEILNLFNKLKLKTQVDITDEEFSKSLSDLAMKEYNNSILTNVSSIASYGLYKQPYIENISAPNLSRINTYAFQECSSLKTFEAPNLNYISTYAFMSCINLQSVNFPNLTTLGNNAFYNCSSLSFASIGKINYIYSSTFYNCSNLETCYLNSSALSYGLSEYAFYNCKKLDATNIINKTSYFGNYCLCNNDVVETINNEVASSITGINIFSNFTKLKTLILPNVKSFGYGGSGNYTVNNCPELETVYFPNLSYLYGGFYNVPKIKNMAFPNCKYLQYNCIYNADELEIVDLPNVVTYSNGAWNNTSYFMSSCPNLKTLNLPNLIGNTTSTSYTSNFCLLNYVGLSELNLPALEKVYVYSYFNLVSNLSNLETLNVPKLTSVIQSQYTNNYFVNIVTGCPKLKTLHLPSLSNIQFGSYFIRNYTAGSNYLPTYYSKYLQAYQETYPSTYSTYSNYITTLSNLSSAGICGVENINLPKLNSFKTYNNYFLYYLGNLKEITLGDGTFTPTQFSLSSNFAYYCPELTKVVLNYPCVITANTAISSIFNMCHHLTGSKAAFTFNNKSYYWANEEGLRDLYFYVPDNLVSSYHSATNWSEYADQIKPLSILYGLNIDKEKIEDNEYENLVDEVSAYSPKVKEIGNYAFYNSSLELALFEQCSSLGKYCFANSLNLKEVLLKKSEIYQFKEGCFMNTSITSIDYPNLSLIGDNCFNNVTTLKEAVIPEVTYIGSNAFANTDLSTLNLPKVNLIKDGAFENNVNLISANLGNVMMIGVDIFKGCTSLTDITFTGYIVPEGDLNREDCTLHVRASLLQDFQTKYPNNTIIGDVE